MIFGLRLYIDGKDICAVIEDNLVQPDKKGEIITNLRKNEVSTERIPSFFGRMRPRKDLHEALKQNPKSEIGVVIVDIEGPEGESFNGKRGILRFFDEKEDRWVVKIEGNDFEIEEQNLVIDSVNNLFS